MSTPTPTPAMFAGRKKIAPSSTSSETSTTSSTPSTPETKNDSKKPFVRKPHLTQNLREDSVLKGIMDELRESEQINRRHGWYDRNRNGKGRLPKGTKPNPRKTRKEKN